MTDQQLRSLHRQFLLGNVPIREMIHAASRSGPAWDWVAGSDDFYKLPNKIKVQLFMERWPLDELSNEWQSLIQEEANATFQNTVRRGRDLLWPGVSVSLGEVLDEELISLGRVNEPDSIPEWLTIEEALAHHVQSIWSSILALRYAGLMEE